MSINVNDKNLDYEELENEEDGVNLFPNDEDGDELADYITRECE